MTAIGTSDTVMEPLTQYMIEARTRKLPPDAALAGKHHILDTIAAMVSGAELEPGKRAIHYVRSAGGHGDASVIGSDVRTSVVDASLANGMLAHADETDDSHRASGTHPGCVVLPAALAVAEQHGASGSALLKAFVLGYDVGCRTMRAVGEPAGEAPRRFSEKGVAGVFLASAAASALLDMSPLQIRYTFGYAAQQASGIASYMTDQSHVEKAFAFGGMPARNGVAAASMVMAGLTGEWDVFQGPHRNFLECFSASPPRPDELISELGTRFEVESTFIKKWCVGSPIQAPADAMLALIEEHGITAGDVEEITVSLAGGLDTVNDRHMPDVNVQYIMAVMLLDGTLTFAAAHDPERMHDPTVLELRRTVRLVPLDGQQLRRSQNRAMVEIRTRDGQLLRQHAEAVRGSPQNPMTTAEVEQKAMDLMQPILGEPTAAQVISMVRDLEQVPDVARLVELLRK